MEKSCAIVQKASGEDDEIEPGITSALQLNVRDIPSLFVSLSFVRSLTRKVTFPHELKLFLQPLYHQRKESTAQIPPHTLFLVPPMCLRQKVTHHSLKHSCARCTIYTHPQLQGMINPQRLCTLQSFGAAGRAASGKTSHS